MDVLMGSVSVLKNLIVEILALRQNFLIEAHKDLEHLLDRLRTHLSDQSRRLIILQLYLITHLLNLVNPHTVFLNLKHHPTQHPLDHPLMQKRIKRLISQHALTIIRYTFIIINQLF